MSKPMVIKIQPQGRLTEWQSLRIRLANLILKPDIRIDVEVEL